MARLTGVFRGLRSRQRIRGILSHTDSYMLRGGILIGLMQYYKACIVLMNCDFICI